MEIFILENEFCESVSIRRRGNELEKTPRNLCSNDFTHQPAIGCFSWKESYIENFMYHILFFIVWFYCLFCFSYAKVFKFEECCHKGMVKISWFFSTFEITLIYISSVQFQNQVCQLFCIWEKWDLLFLWFFSLNLTF